MFIKSMNTSKFGMERLPTLRKGKCDRKDSTTGPISVHDIHGQLLKTSNNLGSVIQNMQIARETQQLKDTLQLQLSCSMVLTRKWAEANKTLTAIAWHARQTRPGNE